ncbi:MAG: hypothetical protein ACWGQW_09010 [bacterium]
MSEWFRIAFWFFVGLLIGLSFCLLSSCDASADEYWSNYPRLPKAEFWLHDDTSWSLHFGGRWKESTPYQLPHIVSGSWSSAKQRMGIYNICQDSTITPAILTPEFWIHSDSTLVIRDTTLSGYDVNLGVEIALEPQAFQDTLGVWHAMIKGAVQFVVGVRPDGFCAYRVMRFYLEPHADRLAYQP